MVLPVLDGPVPKSGNISLLTNRDDAILMPWQMPVGIGRLVERKHSDRTRITTYKSPGEPRQRALRPDQRDRRGR